MKNINMLVTEKELQLISNIFKLVDSMNDDNAYNNDELQAVIEKTEHLGNKYNIDLKSENFGAYKQ